MAASLVQRTAAVASLALTTTTSVRRQQRAAVSTRRGGLAASSAAAPGQPHHHPQRQAAAPQRRVRRRWVALRASADDAAAAAAAATTGATEAAEAAAATVSKGGKGKGKGGGDGKDKEAKGNGADKKASEGPSKNEAARKALMLALEKGEPVSGRVEVANRGGLILRIFNGRFRAFLPLSQMASSRTAGIKGRHTAAPTTRTGPSASFDDDDDDDDDGGSVATPAPPAVAKKNAADAGDGKTQKDATVAAMESQVGSVINVKVTSVDDKKIVVSERALVQDQGAKALKVGVKVSGRVVSLSDFGAFVELSEDDPQAPRLEGLVHISELSWNRISHPRDVVRVAGGRRNETKAKRKRNRTVERTLTATTRSQP